MRTLPAVLLVTALTACVTPAKVQSETTVHESFARLRPAMVVVRGEAREAELVSALYRGLIGKDYSALAPGSAPGPETGIVTARLLTDREPWSAEATFVDPFGTSIYRCRIDGFRGTIEALAAALLRDLPRK